MYYYLVGNDGKISEKNIATVLGYVMFTSNLDTATAHDSDCPYVASKSFYWITALGGKQTHLDLLAIVSPERGITANYESCQGLSAM